MHAGVQDSAQYCDLSMMLPALQHQLAAQAAKLDSQTALLATMAGMVNSLAHTVNDLSSLPGAAKIISPDIARVVVGILSNTNHNRAPAQLSRQAPAHASAQFPVQAPPPAQLSTQAPAQPSARASEYPAQSLLMGHSIAARLSSMDSIGRQMPDTPPAQSMHHAPVLQAAQVAAEAHVMPNNIPKSWLPRQLSDCTTDYSSCDDTSDEAQPASVKSQHGARASADLLVAKYAYEAILKQKQQAAPGSATTSQPDAAATTVAAAAAANNNTFPSCAMGFGLPPLSVKVPQPYPSTSGAPNANPQPQPPVSLAGNRSTSLDAMVEAAEILTSFTADSLAPRMQSSVGKEAYSDPWDSSTAVVRDQAVNHGGPASTPSKKAAAAAVAAGASPARTPGKARKVADKRTSTHFQEEANTCCPETVDALKAAWAATESLPVACVNTSTGTRAEGTFKIIDGKKRIVFNGPTNYADAGTIMDPMEFERAGDRGNTRNWQLSITVAGMYLKKGCRTELKLGHATRILGVHTYPTN